MAERKQRTETGEARKFGVVVGVALAIIGAYLFWRRGTVSWMLLGGAAFFAAAPFVLGALWLRIFRVWMKIAEGLSWVMTRVILSVFFFGILTPMGILARVLGKTPLDLAFKDGKPSYWKKKPEGERSIERYKRLY